MIRSMTAFARQEAQFSWGQVCWELRSVNHRYLDISMRLPEEFRRLETVVRERLQGSLKRGKIDSILYVQPNKKTPLALTHLNLELVQQLLHSLPVCTTGIGFRKQLALVKRYLQAL